MGMYTEVFVNVDLKKDTPKEVIETIRAMCNKDHTSPSLDGKPDRWAYMFNDGSYYLPRTECGLLTKDDLTGSYSLLAKGGIKNYGSEIEQFFDFIKPWVEDDFMGYTRYEEDREPTLFYR